MGYDNAQPNGNGKKRGKRGSVRNDKRLAAITRRRTGEKADWSDSPPDLVLAVVAGITSMGGAVTFGTSRDGGAYSLTLLLDGERETLWFNGNADLDDELQAAIEALTQME